MSSHAISRSSDSRRSTHHTAGWKKNSARRTFCAKLVQSSQRRRCASSCRRIVFSSSAESSLNAHLGKTTAGLTNPMAVGTRNSSQVHISTRRSERKSASVDCSIGSRVLRSTTLQLLRIFHKCQSPTATRANPTTANAAQAANRYKAEFTGIVSAAELAAEFELPVKEIRRNGEAAIATSAQNHTAKRVPELRRPTTRS